MVDVSAAIRKAFPNVRVNPYIPRLAVGAALVAVLCSACQDDGGADAASPSQSASALASAPLVEAAPEEEVDAGPQKHGEAKAAGERVAIAAGSFTAGSLPGDHGRNPSFEPSAMAVELGAFEIDKLPYPNDPGRAAQTGVDRATASKLCSDAGGRLCHELEWERACKGPAGDTYAGGSRWDESCEREPQTCASAEGVLALGSLREWTASDVAPIGKTHPGGAALRGGGTTAGLADHRCAHRGVAKDSLTADDLGFRCCYGDPPKIAVPSPSLHDDPFRSFDLPTTKLEELFMSVPRLASLAADIKYFHQKAGVETILRRSEARATDPPPIPKGRTTAPLWWNPIAGEELVVVTGQSGKSSFIVVFHQLPEGRYRVGAAMVMEDELGPVVLVYDPSVRNRLQWTTCWGCYGEMGEIDYRGGGRVVITQD